VTPIAEWLHSLLSVSLSSSSALGPLESRISQYGRFWGQLRTKRHMKLTQTLVDLGVESAI